MPTTYATPGVYIKELNAFPNSVVAVETALPVFIGYTPDARYKGRSYAFEVVKIDSFQQFQTYFSRRDGERLLPENEQYSPTYYAMPSKQAGDSSVMIGGKTYDVEPDPNSIYYLYNSIKLFYQNGGSTCFVISVGTFGGALRGSAKTPTEPLINTNVVLADLLRGLALLNRETEPTIIVAPDAVLLSPAEHASYNQAALLHCENVKSRVALLDVSGGDAPDENEWSKQILRFREGVGLTGLNYGIAYYPFIRTTVTASRDIDFRQIGGGKHLAELLPAAAEEPLKSLLASSTKPPGPGVPAIQDIENALRNSDESYRNLHEATLKKINTLPPSGAIAGLYALVDGEQGVWHAPANRSLASVNSTTLKITDEAQKQLNVDSATGKSINAIRVFSGRGTLVWGGRTLDGNSEDWRYINVRRTLIMIEQSMKQAAQAYVFQPNDANTWSLIKSMLSNFLDNLWRQGALVGATAPEAYSVNVGLGTTMTGDDILNGIMNIHVKVAISRPAEFIVLTFQQQMQTS